ncbi:MAG TPA: hypothetical protein VKA70_18430 [Blastocatellia bacterium]|nr:hypothetical protein [Blastocatellia bacterium]
MDDIGRSVHPNALPNYQDAVIEQKKLEGFSLNPFHDYGKNHARVFKSALDFDQSNWALLAQRIQEGLPYCEAVLKKDFQYGKLYEVVLPITGPNGKTLNVLTAWIIEIGTDYPFLVTTYVLTDT